MDISLADAILQNTAGQEEGLPKDVPSGYDWYHGYLYASDAPPSGFTAMTGYGHIYQIVGSSDYTAPGLIELANFRAYVRLAADKSWVLVQDQASIGGAHFVGDFVDNASIPMDLNQLGSGNWTMDPPPVGYNCHWWSDPRGSYTADTIDQAFVIYDIRVTDPAASGRLVAGAGIDWWLDAGAPYVDPVGTNNPAAGIGNWQIITTTFKPVCFYSAATSAAFSESLPPPVIEGGVDPGDPGSGDATEEEATSTPIVAVAGADTFWIVPQQTTYIEFIQGLRRIFRDWNITATDKLRVFENSAGSGITSTITRAKVTAGSVKFSRADALSIPRQRMLTFIDVNRDNDINSVPARLERFPVPATSSQNPETIELPIGTTEDAAQALVNESLLIDDLARKKMAYTGMNALYGSEPGDIVYYAPDPNISFVGRVTSVARRAADYATEITAEQISFLGLSNLAPAITSNGGGATAAVTIDENTTAVTTVAATDVNNNLLTYSIIGGADAGKFTIDSLTGVLAFLTAPNFEAPTDANGDNDYVVIVQASDGDLTDSQTITVTVADVLEDTAGTATPIGLLLTLTREP